MDARNPPRLSRPCFPGGTLSIAFALFVALSFGVPLSPQTARSDKQETYTIRGTVINSVTHAPVGRALIFTSDNQLARLTDDQGYFEFKVSRPAPEQNFMSGPFLETFSSQGVTQSRRITADIPLAPFMARKPGYLEPQFTEPPLDPETAASSELRISLIPEALIVGHVHLPANDGSEPILVELYRHEVQGGRARWIPSGTNSTRASGEFRFANLREGEYKLFTQELIDRDALTFDPRGPLFGFPPVYYPASEDFETAAQIHLKAGETFSATLAPSRREYFPVKIAVPDSGLAGGSQITVERQGHRGPGFSLGFDPADNAIVGLLPNGTYTLEVTQYGETGSSGLLNFSVNGAPSQGLSMQLAQNSSIEVRLIDLRANDLPVTDQRSNPGVASGPRLRDSLNILNLTLVSMDELAPGNLLQLQPPKNQDDETFSFGNVQPGRYWVRSGCGPSEYVSEITSGGRDLLRQPLDVGFGATVPPIELTLRDDGAQIEGTIEGWPQPQSQYFVKNVSRSFFRGIASPVMLLPLSENSSPSRMFCQAWVDQDGKFNFSQVPPGEYLAIAFDRLRQDLEYENPEALKNYEEQGQVLRLGPGQREKLRLKLNIGSE